MPRARSRDPREDRRARSGWTPTVKPVDGDATYTATFKETSSSSGGPGGGPYIPGETPFTPFYPFTPFAPGGGSGGAGGAGGSGTPGGSSGSGGSGSGGSGSGTDGTPGGGSGGTVELPFTDVSPDSPYYDDISYVYENIPPKSRKVNKRKGGS